MAATGRGYSRAVFECNAQFPPQLALTRSFDIDYRRDGKQTLKLQELATRFIDTIAITSETGAQRVDLVEQIERERYARRVQLQISRQSLRGHGSAQTSTAEPPFLDARAL